ncbi:hypothetical protein MCOR25_008371 [Pyricularia grisea]|uniref:Nudix hydrolase domain-containing protein n=1 Tax=Pyricularia grisea TaxID=148305 RepID=A0A6P8AML6_PYRGI|nr:uncharacterized protein PgNI_12470 [Pyricularia grisea]KAI6355010.1 hypothetical protein MCOR25_008371 [Pyricularia grisea]TLD03259.1 hypothetical protein PgNI_12470 [Pyricularia grisea]
MKFSLFYLTFGLVPATLSAGDGASGSYRRCGVVPFTSDGEVWMIPSEKSGWILPKGKIESDDSDTKECAAREAREEGGFYFSQDLQYVGAFVDTVWYTGTVTTKGEPTDKKNANRGPAKHFKSEVARKHLEGMKKKASMLTALDTVLGR